MISHRFYAIIFLSIIIISLLVYRIAFVSFNNENVEKVNLALMNRTPISLQRLNEQVEKLELMTKDIDSYTFSTIKNEIETTVRLVSQTNIELKAQYDAWIKVKSTLKNDGESLTKLKEQLDTTRNLQEKEILKLKNILDDVTKPSITTDFKNILLTFILGILSSILATMVHTMWKNRKIKHQ